MKPCTMPAAAATVARRACAPRSPWLALLLAPRRAARGTAAVEWQGVERVVAFADVHGAYAS